jgi:hypothetical protein
MENTRGSDTYPVSPQYGKWRELLHHFYDPFPVVEHFEAVV